MSSLETRPAQITERIERIDELTNQLSELRQKNNDRQGRKDQLKEKNKAFVNLKTKISQTSECYSSLQKWVDLAVTMDIAVPQAELDDTVANLARVLQEFNDSRYESYENANEINDLKDTFERYRGSLKDHINNVQSLVEKRCQVLKDRVSTTETMLRIPDIGGTEDRQKVTAFKSALTQLENGEVISPGNYEQVKADYEEVEIDIDAVKDRYDLSDEAGAVLMKFLNQETVTMADVDGDVLAELQALEEFSKRLSIQFRTQ